MGPESGLIFALLCWAAGEVAAYPPWDFSWGDPASRGVRPDPYAWSWVEDPQSRAISSRQPVTVQCQEAQLVVTVQRDLFGTGRLVNAADLTLGPAACKHSSLNPAHNTVTFTAGLHECGSIVQVRPSPSGPSPSPGIPPGIPPPPRSSSGLWDHAPSISCDAGGSLGAGRRAPLRNTLGEG